MLQNNTINATKNNNNNTSTITNSTLSPAICDGANGAIAGSTVHSKLYKSEDIPLTISASLAKQTSASLMRNGARKNPTHDIVVNDYSTVHDSEHYQDSNESNYDDDDGDSTYNTPHSNAYIHYSTMNSNGGDYLRKTTNHLHRNVNNNSSTLASTNRYRWHNQSDEIALQSLRNNSMTIAASTKTNAMHSNHRAHTSGRKQQHQHLNQINNNFIVTNKKHAAMIPNSYSDQNSIDQNNGNHFPSRLYH